MMMMSYFFALEKIKYSVGRAKFKIKLKISGFSQYAVKIVRWIGNCYPTQLSLLLTIAGMCYWWQEGR